MKINNKYEQKICSMIRSIFNFTQEELSDATGVSLEMIIKWEEECTYLSDNDRLAIFHFYGITSEIIKDGISAEKLATIKIRIDNYRNKSKENDTINNRDIFDLCYDMIEYPDKELKLNGLPRNTGFSNISYTYLNALIENINIIEGILVKYFSTLREDIDENTCTGCWQDLVEKCMEHSKNNSHYDFSNDYIFPNRDDVLILAESDNDYWCFWYHNSGRSDVFRFDKEGCRYSKEQLITFLRYSANKLGNGYYYIIPNLQCINY